MRMATLGAILTTYGRPGSTTLRRKLNIARLPRHKQHESTIHGKTVTAAWHAGKRPHAEQRRERVTNTNLALVVCHAILMKERR